MAQTLRDSDPFIYSDALTHALIHCTPRYTLDMETYNKTPLYLSDKIENFNYKGYVACEVIIDSLERSIIKVQIIKINLSNEQDSIVLKMLNDIQIDEYSGEHSELIHQMYPYIKSYVLDVKLIRDEYAAPSSLIRFYALAFRIKIL
jgi:hypothetical protein